MSRTHAASNQRDWLAFVTIWAAAVVVLCVRNFWAPGIGPFFADTDDAMRMVTAGDLLNGQDWFDLVQHRMNTPFGAEIHWSRLIDLPLATFLGLAQGFLAPAEALIVAGTVWPMLLLGMLLWLSARTAIELVGRHGVLPALALPVLSPAVLAEFDPGRVDHHNVIIVLSVGIIFSSIVALRRPIGAWLAGMLCATALAVAIEALPIVIAAIVAFGLTYVVDHRSAVSLRRFGLSFAGGMLVHLALARPPSLWLEAACDMISPVFVFGGLLVGLTYLLVSVLPAPRILALRLALLSVLGLAAIAAVVTVYPQCLEGPYGTLDPWLQRNWIAAIVEAKPWHVSLFDLPSYTLVVSIPVLLGLVFGVIALWRDPARRLAWLVLLTFIIATAAVMFAQIRGARLAVLPVIPVAAWVIVRARGAYLERPRIGSAVRLLASWLIFAGIALSVIVNATLDALPAGRSQQAAVARASKQPCLASAAFETLRTMPPQAIMAPVDLGSHLLLETGHAVVSAPYHRNGDGVLDTFRFLNRPATEARDIAIARNLDLFVTCDAMPEMRGAGLREPDTVNSLLAAGSHPDWMEPVTSNGPLRIYRIVP